MKLIEICPVGVALLHSDGRTNMTRPSRFFQLLCERATKKNHWLYLPHAVLSFRQMKQSITYNQ